jgi:hypothetical protein
MFLSYRVPTFHTCNPNACICSYSRRNLAATFNFHVTGLTHIFLRLLALPVFHLLLWIFYSGMEDYQRTFVTRNGLIFNCLAGAYFMSIIVTASTCKCVCSLSQGNCSVQANSWDLIVLKIQPTHPSGTLVYTNQARRWSNHRRRHTDWAFRCCSSCIQDTILSRGPGGSLQWTPVSLKLLFPGCAICCDIRWSCNTHHISVGTSS